VKGLPETLGKNGVCSNYSYDTVEYTWQNIRTFRGGNAVFTHPSTPIKCGGAPQKIVYLADDYFRRSGVRQQSQLNFYHAGAAIFAVKKYADALNRVVARKGINVHFQHDLIEVRAARWLIPAVGSMSINIPFSINAIPTYLVSVIARACPPRKRELPFVSRRRCW
jgi:NADPH-dependent 2,4-dienoyl-CoA reductase/sulfur reductase-like enzyme